MNIKLLAAACLMVSGLTAMGNDVFVYDGTHAEPIQSMNDVKKITFTENAITLVGADGTETTVDFTAFSYFTFVKEEMSGIEDVAKGGDIAVTVRGGMLDVNATEPIARVEMYSMQGQRMLSLAPDAASVSESIAHCANGIYIVKVVAGGNEKVQKIIKR